MARKATTLAQQLHTRLRRKSLVSPERYSSSRLLGNRMAVLYRVVWLVVVVVVVGKRRGGGGGGVQAR